MNSNPQDTFQLNTTTVVVNKNLVVLAQVLQRLETSTEAVDAEQYRSVGSPLEPALAAELAARSAIERMKALRS